MPRVPLLLLLDLARVDRAEDPFAFRFEPQDYLARTEGGGLSRLHLEWDQTWLADLAALRRPAPPTSVLQRVGERLAHFLAEAGWGAQAAAIDGVVRAGGAVIVTVRSAAAELYTLPWELLTVGASGQHLGELDGVVIRYEWPETATVPETRPPRGDDGRILVAWSAAGGEVPAAEHIAAIAGACEAGGRPFDPVRDVLARASAGGLEERLEAALASGPPIDVLHLLCHGEGGPEGGLILDGPAGSAARVDPASLRRILRRFAGMVRLVVFAACESADPGAAANALGGLTQLLHRAGAAAVIGSRFPLAIDASVRFTEALYRGLACELLSLEEAVSAGRRRLRGTPGELSWATLQLHARAADGDDSRPLVIRPYRGLLAFGPRQGRLFFGRDREIAEIRGDLEALGEARRPRLLVVAGASGSGKSSVVLGGFVPRLVDARAPAWRWASLRPGEAPLAALAAAASKLVGEPVTADPEAIAAALAGLGEARPDQQFLLVIDQLEELFTHGADADARQAFVRLLWRVAGAGARPIAVITTLRVDFIGRCGELVVDDEGLRFDRIAYDERHRIFIPRADRRLLREVIEAPARATGLALEPGLVERILDDVDDEAGALPAVSHALERLWLRRSGRALTQAAYEAIGGVTGALAGHAEASVEGLDDDELAQARRLLIRLVSGGGEGWAADTRARTPLARVRPEGASAAAFDRVVERLTDARLLVVSEAEGEADAAPEAFIEVAHEALIRAWPRLRRWVLEDRQRLGELQRLAAWVADHGDRGTVLDGPRLAFAQEFARRYPDDVDARARALIAASVDADEAAARVDAERRAALERSLHQTRKAAVTAGLIATLALVLLFVTEWTLDAFQRENLLRLDAPLYALVERMPKDDPMAVLDVLAEIEITDEAAWLSAADDSLRRLPEQRLISTAPTIRGLAIGDAGRVALRSARGELWILGEDPEGPGRALDVAPIAAVGWREGALIALAESGDLLEFESDGERLADPTVLRTLELGGPAAMVVSADRRRPRVALREPEDRRARLVALDSDDLRAIDGGAATLALTFIDDGRSLLTAPGDLAAPDVGDRDLRIWDTQSGALRSTLAVDAGVAIAVAASSDRGRILAVTGDGDLLAWPRAAAAGPERQSAGHGPLLAAAFEPARAESILLATAAGALAIQALDRLGRPTGPSIDLGTFTGGVDVEIAWSPDGAQVFVADPGGVRQFRADGRHHDPRTMSEAARRARVYEIARCAPFAAIAREAAAHGIDPLAPRDLCASARADRLSQEIGEGEALLVFIPLFLFTGELLLVGAALLLRRRRASVRPPLRAELGPPALGLAIIAVVLALAGALGFSAINVLGEDDGTGVIGVSLALTWLVTSGLRARSARADARRPVVRVALRLAQLVALAGALVLGAFAVFGLVVSPLGPTVDDDARPVLWVFYLLIATFICLYTLGLARISQWLRSPARG